MNNIILENCALIVSLADDSKYANIERDKSIYIEDGIIRGIGSTEKTEQTEQSQSTIIDCRGLTAIPGLIQTHTHICQTALRNRAEDLDVLAWLKRYIWPGEAALERDDLIASAYLGIGELLLGGTTTILDMATVRHTDSLFEVLKETGIRAFSGKCLMDDPRSCPPYLCDTTTEAISESEMLIEKWHGAENGRLQYALNPRFALSCTADLFGKIISFSEKYNLLIHTHASENLQELEIIKKRTGYGNIEYFERIGLLSSKTCLAHCIHLEDGDMERLKNYNVRVLHCPWSNLKLASGVAPVPAMLENNISVSLGSDGAPCNNLLDTFSEMRLAALIHRPKYGPDSMPAERVFRMATVEGARALGLQDEIGSIKKGYKGDIVLLDLNQHHNLPVDNIFNTLVYSTRADDVRHVLVDGQILVKDRKFLSRNFDDKKKEFIKRQKIKTTNKKFN